MEEQNFVSGQYFRLCQKGECVTLHDRNDTIIMKTTSQICHNIFKILRYPHLDRPRERANCHGFVALAMEEQWSDYWIYPAEERGPWMDMWDAEHRFGFPYGTQIWGKSSSTGKDELIHSAIVLGRMDDSMPVVIHKSGTRPISMTRWNEMGYPHSAVRCHSLSNRIRSQINLDIPELFKK
jgi:hypothetical protein